MAFGKGAPRARRSRFVQSVFPPFSKPLLQVVTAASLAGMAGFSATAGPQLPTGGVVQSGTASIGSPANGTLTINQRSAKAIINWNSFSIGQAATVDFNNGSGATLNRVTGTGTSNIDGSLNATGGVYLINRNGIIVGPQGVVKVGGNFVASTLDTSNDRFNAGGSLTFSGNSSGVVINEGKIGSLGGDVALVAQTASNQGTVTAANGAVGVLAGTRVTLRDSTLDEGKFSVDVGGANTSATNSGSIAAAEVELKANGGNVYALAGNTGGVIAATGVSNNDGRVLLIAGGTGSVTANTTISATISTGAGGTVETSGGHVNFTGADIKASRWLVDPVTLNVDAAAAATIDSSLNSGTSVTLQTTATGSSGPGTASTGQGDITVTAPLIWNAHATLKLDAYHGIAIDAPMTISGPGGLVLVTNDGGTGGDLSFGLSDTGFAGSVQYTGTPNTGQSLSINGTPYTLLYSMSDVQSVNNSATTLAGDYALAKPITATGLAAPIGTDGAGNVLNSGNGFNGTLEGLGNAISNLTVNSPTTNYVGLFGYIGASGTVANLQLTNANVTGLNDIGVLAGWSNGTIEFVAADGSATGSVIESSGGTSGDTGGLVGHNAGTITRSSALVTVASGQGVGGLVGNSSGTIFQSWAGGSVSGAQDSIGGLAGGNGGTISQSYAIGNVTGAVYSTGGLVGGNGGTIMDSFATGHAQGPYWYNSGGLVGENDGTIETSYSIGPVNGFGLVGGLIGVQQHGGATTNSYWDISTSGIGIHSGIGSASDAPGVAGETTQQLQGTLPSGFNSSVWGTGTGLFPYLLWQSPSAAPLAISGTAYSDKGTSAMRAGAVSLLVNGKSLGSVTTGTNGYYYFLVPQSVASTSSQILAYTSGGASFVDDAATPQSNLDIWGNYLRENVSAAAIAGEVKLSTVIADLATAIGSTNAAVQSFVNGLGNVDINDTASLDIDIPQTVSHNLTIDPTSGGDITVTAPVTLTGTNTLTLDAFHSIKIAAPVTISGAGKLVLVTNDGGTGGDLDFGLSSGGFAGNVQFTGTPNTGQSLNINGTPYTLLYSMSDLQGINTNGTTLAGNYALAKSLDATGISNWVPIGTDGQGHLFDSATGYFDISTPNNTTTGFSGNLEGLGNTVSNLNINGGASNYMGLFGYSSTTVVRDVGVVGGTVSGTGSWLGGLVASADGDTVIENAYSTDNVTGADGNTPGGSSGHSIGGLVGDNGGSLQNSFATGSVTGTVGVGGLAGADSGIIQSSYATGAVAGFNAIGGLTGLTSTAHPGYPVIDNSYATGNVTSTGDQAGGLVGFLDGGIAVTNSYATGNVTGTTDVGGLVGVASNEVDIPEPNVGSQITNSSASGNVTGSTYVGGLAGAVVYPSVVSGSEASGHVAGGQDVGGLVGVNDGAIRQSLARGYGVYATGDDVGGLVGYQSSTGTIDFGLTQLYVSGNDNVGGLVGNNVGGAITDSGATNIVTGAESVGGLVGINGVDNTAQARSSDRSAGVGRPVPYMEATPAASSEKTSERSPTAGPAVPSADTAMAPADWSAKTRSSSVAPLRSRAWCNIPMRLAA
jgi:filamentous hemagglutinin family protein